MKLLVAVGFALLAVPLARADSILFATESVPAPVQVMQMEIGGHGALTIASAPVLDRAADGALLTTDEAKTTLLVDGRPVAHVDWPIDEAHFSSDGREIVFTSPDVAPNCYEYCQLWHLWLVERDGSGLRELSTDGRAPRFSPDGRRLAYLQGPRGESAGGYLTVLELATGTRTKFAFTDDNAPAWSPRSNAIAYSTYGTDSFGSVFVATLASRRLVLLARHAEAPAFSPDGRSIVYLGRSGLTVQGLASGRAVVVAQAGQVSYDYSVEPPRVVWCTSQWLAYAGVTSRNPVETGQLFRVRADGTNRGALTSFAPNTAFPWIECRGSTLTFQITRDRRGLATIDDVDLSNGNVAQLTKDAGDDRSPTLAPDGSLAYSKGVFKHEGWYCLVVKGRCLTKARAGRAIVEPPAWSPDGRRLAMLDAKGGIDAANGAIDLSVVDVATGTTRVVHRFGNFVVKSSTSHEGGVTRFVVGGVYTNNVASPTWSPDGKTIALASDQPAQPNAPPSGSHLWLVDVVTGRATEIAPDVLAADPSWSPDGKTIAFNTYSRDAEAHAIDLLDLATGAVTTLVSLPSWGGVHQARCRAAWSPDSTQLAYQAPDGSLHVIRRDATGDRTIVPSAVPGSAIAWRH